MDHAVTFSIDWLHINEPHTPATKLHRTTYPTMGEMRMVPTTPTFGYAVGWQNPYGARIMSNDNRQDMGVFVGYSSSTIRTYAEKINVLGIDILRWHIHQHHSVSRIDLALDLYNTGAKLTELYELLDTGKYSGTAKTFTHITSANGGETVYIGSRSSDVFIRVYNKAAEQRVSEDWLRIELEIKGKVATPIARQLCNSAADNQLYTVAKSLLFRSAQCEHKLWHILDKIGTVELATADKKEKDTTKWLLETVALSMAKQCQAAGNFDLLNAFTDKVVALSGVGVVD